MSSRFEIPPGVVLYDGPSELGPRDVVAIATFTTGNKKTGPQIQVWIFDKLLHPVEVSHAGLGQSVCGVCPLQGVPVKNPKPNGPKVIGRVCYVNLGHGSSRVWKAWKAGNYPAYRARVHSNWFKNRSIRWGADGDPAALPIELVESITALCADWTGFSHQLFWIDRKKADRLARLVMCSVHNKAQLNEARRRGWRSYVVHQGDHDKPDGAIQCPHIDRPWIRCIDCHLCKGQAKGAARDISSPAHGIGRHNFAKLGASDV